MNSIDVLDRFVGHAMLLDCNGRRFKKPGQLVEHLGPSARATLAAIRSDEVAKMRVSPEETEGVAELARKARRGLLLDFDRRISR